ncbi:MAG: hypothetical protein JHC87_00955, partial [Thermoleophilaceae bacterium]|nr:hypothetical protein [Thermoleophilaceae bacterium]
RLGGGFRMGPFELSDLVGIDVGFEIAQSFYQLSFGEPRWQPSPIPAKLIAGGRLGRKSKRGYYSYAEDGTYRGPDPEPLLPESGGGTAVVLGDGQIASQLRRLAQAAGYDVVSNVGNNDKAGEATVIVDARLQNTGTFVNTPACPVFLLCAAGSLAQLARGRDMAGFHCLAPLAQSHLVELTNGSGTSDATASAAAHFFHSLGKHTEWVGDGPGLILGRIVCQLINEATFAVQEQVGTALDIDQGVRLGLNYPHGLLEWGDTIGIEHVLATLSALQAETGSDRYRPAQLMRKMVAEGKLGVRSGQGFYRHSSA